jgi:hypothetical protein
MRLYLRLSQKSPDLLVFKNQFDLAQRRFYWGRGGQGLATERAVAYNPIMAVTVEGIVGGV